VDSNLKSVTDASFSSDVLQQVRPVLVDFWAEWCAPCRLLVPVLESISEEHGDELLIVKVNVDENPETTAEYSVTSIPTMIVYEHGKVAKTIVGVKPKSVLLKEIEDFVAPVNRGQGTG
jgi:thioredoxin 1